MSAIQLAAGREPTLPAQRVLALILLDFEAVGFSLAAAGTQ